MILAGAAGLTCAQLAERVEQSLDARLDRSLRFCDPLFDEGISVWSKPMLIVILKAVVVFAFLLIAVMFMIWFERKVISDMQDRIGPNRAGPWGLLQTLADGTKLFFKENLFPDKADKWVFRLAPYLSAVPAFLAFSIVPIGGKVTLFGHETMLQLADPPMGILFTLAVSSIAVYGVMLAGWSSGSKYPLLGSVRASAQMVSYEAAMGLSIAAVVLVSNSLRPGDIVANQLGLRWHLWILGFLPAIIFAIAATAELNRPPFDLVEAESELVGGFHTEYSSARFAFFFLAEFMNVITMSAITVTLFFGGPSIPWDVPILTDVSPVWFLVKVLVFLFGYVWLRATLPRFRYDQLMDLGWKRLIPASLLWLLVIAALQLEEDFGKRMLYLAVAVPAVLVAAGVLWLAIRRGREHTEREVAEAMMAAGRGSNRGGRF